MHRIFPTLIKPLYKFSINVLKIQPPHLTHLSRKIFNQFPTPQHPYLFDQLLKQNKLKAYFQSKNIQDFTLHDLYFYLSHLDKFHQPNSEIHLALIKNKSLDTYSSFLIAQQISALSDHNCQTTLINLLNLNSKSLSLQQLRYCIKLIKNFQRKSLLDIPSIKSSISQPNQPLYNPTYLQLLFCLSQFKPLNQVVNLESFLAFIKKFGQQDLVTKGATIPIKYFYFAKVFQSQLNLKVPSNIQLLRQNHIQVKIIQAKTQQQLQYCVKLLPFYSQFTFFIMIQKLSPKLYIIYLQYLYQQKIKDPNFIITKNPMYYRILYYASKQEFLTIIQFHQLLLINNFTQLGMISFNIINNKLSSFLALVQYLNDHEIYDLSIWKSIQKAFIHRLNLNSKNRNLQQISKNYDILRILQLLVYMQDNKLGSTYFWKHSHHFLYDFIMKQHLINQISIQNKNKFIISCYRAFGIRSFSIYLGQKLKKLCLFFLINNKWSIDELYQLTKILAKTKNGDLQIWHGIQLKLLLIKIKQSSDQQIKNKMVQIFTLFKSMKKGTCNYYYIMNKLFYNKILPKSQFINQSSTHHGV